MSLTIGHKQDANYYATIAIKN